jgi:hypothetical protein
LAKFLPVAVGAFLPDLSSVDDRSIAHLPRLALGFFGFRRFGFQVASALARRNLPSLPPKAGERVFNSFVITAGFSTKENWQNY